MGRRYLEVHAKADSTKPWAMGERTKSQRSLAQRDKDDIEPLALDFLSSVESFAAYEPRDEAFHDVRKPLGTDWHQEGSPVTNRLAARIESAGIAIKGDLPELRYLDREIVPSRTTGERHFEEPDEGTRLRIDLLLATESRPVVCEVKALGDENAYYALIQGLAGVAQLAPPKQRTRMKKAYPGLSDEVPLELFIVLSRHNSRGEDKGAMADLSREIAEQLIVFPGVSEVLSAIRCVDAEIPQPSGPVLISPHQYGASSPV
jgi:hypothetical protein